MRFALKQILAFATCFFCLSGLSSQFGPEWEEALASYERQDFESAERGFENWIRIHEAQGVRSAQAHHNLALTKWQLEKRVDAIYHLLSSISLRTSPLRIWSDLDSVQEMEKKIGVVEPVSGNFLFKNYFLMNPNLMLLFTSFTVWTLVLFLLYLRRGTARSRTFFGALFVLLATVTISTYINVNRLGEYAVLHDGSGLIPIFEEIDSEKASVKFPSGMIVRTGSREDRLVRITEPVSGWVQRYQLLLF